MAAYDTLRSAIDSYIKANGNKEITGTVLNDILNAMVSALGADTRFAGVAVPTTNPGNPEGNVVYFASQAGTYSNFGGIVLPLGIHILVWNGTAWTSQTWFSVDNTPTQNSQNLATSGGILQAIVDAVGVERLRAIGAEVTSCSFDGTTKKISFFNSADDTLFQLDATAFVIDGMVSDVKIEDGNLVIQFNTDAGKQDIEIPLTDIFNPANYYTKTAIDALLALYYTKTETDALLTAINNKLADGCLYRGMAEPTTNPPTPTTKVFYIATKAGTYTNFGNIAVTEGITILKYDGSNWSKEQISYSDGVFDISAYNGTSYADLSAALGTNGANIPQNLRKGGMSIKFVQSSDNKYIQYMYKGTSTPAADFTNVDNWEKINNAEEVDKLDSFVNDGIGTKDETVYPTNLLNKNASDFVQNHIIDPDDGQPSINYSNLYSSTGFIPCTPGDEYYYNDGTQYRYAQYVLFYDEQKAYLGSQYVFTSTNIPWTIPNGAYFMRLTLSITGLESYTMQITKGSAIIPYSEYFEPIPNIKYYFKNPLKKERNIVNILNSDSEQDVFTKLLQAYNNGNTDVYFEFGTYTFSDIYIYMRDTLSWSWTMEIPIGNNNRYFFNGSTIISNAPSVSYTGSRNIFGCKAGNPSFRENTNFELHDGILINNGGTYCVHDECAESNIAYKHVYDNVVMKYVSADTTQSIAKCIGGGVGKKSGVVIIQKCCFSSDNPNNNEPVISWHGLMDEGSPDTNFKLSVTDCYLTRNLIINGYFKDGDSIYLLYCNNANRTNPYLQSGIESVVFNNQINQ